MSSVLGMLLGWHFILFGLITAIVICLLVSIFKKHPNILLGSSALLQSPSGIFGLLTLAAISLVTWHQPSVGGAAFAAFVTIVPAILSWTEHKETMAGLPPVAPPVPSPTPAPVVITIPVVEAPPPDNSAKPVIGSPDAPVA